MEITKSFVENFGTTFEHLYQQKKSVLSDHVRRESQHSLVDYFNQIGQSEPEEVVLYNSDTTYKETPHDVRAVKLRDWARAEIIDKKAKLRMLLDPTSSYLESMCNGFLRTTDRLLIDAALGEAIRSPGPQNGSLIPTPLPASQTIGVNYVTSGPPVNSGLTVGKIVEARARLEDADVPEDDPTYIVCSYRQIKDMLIYAEQTSDSAVTEIKALYDGKIKHFMGFEFLTTNLVPRDPATKIRSCFAYAKSALLLSEGEGITKRVSELPTKHYATQAYISMSMGATRMQESGVVPIMCEQL